MAVKMEEKEEKKSNGSGFKRSLLFPLSPLSPLSRHSPLPLSPPVVTRTAKTKQRKRERKRRFQRRFLSHHS
jgi:hypothetical protein